MEERNVVFHPIICSIQKIALYETKSVRNSVIQMVIGFILFAFRNITWLVLITQKRGLEFLKLTDWNPVSCAFMTIK